MASESLETTNNMTFLCRFCDEDFFPEAVGGTGTEIGFGDRAILAYIKNLEAPRRCMGVWSPACGLREEQGG